MKEMPRYSRFRPHFMAPGPHVEIMEDKPISFDQVAPSPRHAGGDDEDSTGYRYYPSHKLLGKLFDGVDEREIFQHVQRNSSRHALHRIDRGWDRDKSLLEGVWDHIEESCPGIKWDSHLDLARGIRDEQVFPPSLFFLTISFHNCVYIARLHQLTDKFFRYEYSLLDIMYEYGPRPNFPLSEVEVFIGNILGKTGALPTHQRELCISMKDRFADILSFTVKWIRREECDHEDAESRPERAAPEYILGLSMACLWVALNEGSKIWESGKNRRSKLRSFGYVAAAVGLAEVEHVFAF